jgi:hypothetical protein
LSGLDLPPSSDEEEEVERREIDKGPLVVQVRRGSSWRAGQMLRTQSRARISSRAAVSAAAAAAARADSDPCSGRGAVSCTGLCIPPPPPVLPVIPPIELLVCPSMCVLCLLVSRQLSVTPRSWLRKSGWLWRSHSGEHNTCLRRRLLSAHLPGPLRTAVAGAGWFTLEADA